MPKLQPVLLVILDGWGIRKEREDNAIAPRRHPEPGPRLARDYPSPSCRPPGSPSGCPTGRWATRRWATPTSAPGGSSTRTWSASTAPSRTASSSQNPVLLAAIGPGQGATARRSTCSASSPTAASTPSMDHLLRAARAAPRRAGVDARLRPRLPRRARHAAAERARATCGSSEQPAQEIGAAARSPPSSAATTRWTATSAGTGWSRPIDAIVRGQGPKAPSARRRHASRLRREGDRRVRQAHRARQRRRRARSARIRDGDAVIFFNFRADRARELTRALADPDFKEFDRGAGSTLGRLRLHDPVRRDLRPAGGLRARAARARSSREVAGRGRAQRSSAPPRPRSTPTSPSSSTAAARRSSPARSGILVPSPARREDLRPEAGDERAAR